MQTISKGSEENNSEIRHGLKYLPREKQPSMYDILSWEHDPLKSKDWLVKMQPEYRQPKFTAPQFYEKPQHIASPQKYELQFVKSQTKHQLKPHHITHQLYDYGEEQISPSKKKQIKQDKNKQKKDKERSKPKEVIKLNQFNAFDKKQIELRKKNIKGFRLDSRELPDSAFTTYFGKPAFAHYGSGSNSKMIAKHKSHSVMPHAGKNKPEFVQCHIGALQKANMINLDTRVPKKPIQDNLNQQCHVKVSQYYNVEIAKPDLINEVRFSTEDNHLKLKGKTPSHKDLNQMPHRKYPPPLHVGNKKKKKQIRSKTQQKQDGLAFMNRRSNFMNEVADKKKVHNRLAFKVTECYPLDWDNETEANSTAREDKWKKVRPAGISSNSAVYLKTHNNTYLAQ